MLRCRVRHHRNHTIAALAAGTPISISPFITQTCSGAPGDCSAGCSAGCQGGVTLQLKPGDVLNMPPDTEHWVTEPEPSGPNAGFTYMLFKINAGLYPWQLVDFDF
jgi:hypothetical protein